MVRYYRLQKIISSSGSHRGHTSGQGACGDRGHEERGEGEAERRRENGAMTALALRNRANKLKDAMPKINGQREHGPELNHNCVHFPEAIVQIDVQECFAD